MKMKLLAISVMSAALAFSPAALLAQDVEVKDKNGLKEKAEDKSADLNRKTHDSLCKGKHGTVTAKDDNSVTIDGKRYAFTADTRLNKQSEALLSKSVKVGDTVCYKTEKAADGSEQVAGLMALSEEEKVRVREKENGTTPKVDVETPEKKIEVK